MTEKTETGDRRRPAAARTAHDDDHNENSRGEPGMDLPVVGHVPYTSIGFLAGIGVAGVAGALEWPVVAAVGVGYVLARRGGQR